MTPSAVGRTFRGSGLDRALPYLMLGPTLFLVLGVIVYPLIDGLRSSTGFYRFGREIRSVGLDNYRQAFGDPATQADIGSLFEGPPEVRVWSPRDGWTTF